MGTATLGEDAALVVCDRGGSGSSHGHRPQGRKALSRKRYERCDGANPPAVAVIRSKQPDRKNHEVMRQIIGSAAELDEMGRDDRTGTGSPSLSAVREEGTEGRRESGVR